MKKILLSLAVAAVTFSSLPAFAQSPSSTTPSCETPAACPHAGKGDKKPAFNSFEGITLTDDQKASFEALRSRRAADCAARQQADSTARAERREARRTQARANLDEIKAILTPEQYVIYLENIVINSPEGRPGHGQQARGGKKGQPGQPGHDQRGRGHGRHGQRGGQPQAPAAAK